MHITLRTISLVVAGLLATGYLVGQIQGTPLVAAASKHATTKVTKAKVTKAKVTKAKVTKKQTATTGSAHADGKVTAVNGNTITVAADADPAGSTEYTKVTTILLTDTTTYKSSTTKASIVVGSYVIAEGTLSNGDTTLTATSVGIGGLGGGHGGSHVGGHGGPHADGTVTVVSGNTITVAADTDPAGSTEYTKVITILLTDTTTYDGTSTKASIVVGAKISADGTLSPDGTTLTATHVDIR